MIVVHLLSDILKKALLFFFFFFFSSSFLTLSLSLLLSLFLFWLITPRTEIHLTVKFAQTFVVLHFIQFNFPTLKRDKEEHTIGQLNKVAPRNLLVLPCIRKKE